MGRAAGIALLPALLPLALLLRAALRLFLPGLFPGGPGLGLLLLAAGFLLLAARLLLGFGFGLGLCFCLRLRVVPAGRAGRLLDGNIGPAFLTERHTDPPFDLFLTDYALYHRGRGKCNAQQRRLSRSLRRRTGAGRW